MLAGYVNDYNSSASNVGERGVDGIEAGGRGASGAYDTPEGQTGLIDGTGPLRTWGPRSPDDEGRAGGRELVSVRRSGCHLVAIGRWEAGPRLVCFQVRSKGEEHEPARCPRYRWCTVAVGVGSG